MSALLELIKAVEVYGDLPDSLPFDGKINDLVKRAYDGSLEAAEQFIREVLPGGEWTYDEDVQIAGVSGYAGNILNQSWSEIGMEIQSRAVLLAALRGYAMTRGHRF